MIQEAYVSYEVAKLLKEKGFDISTFCYYSEQDKHFDYPDDMVAYNWNSHFKDYVSAPTQQMAMRWLREVHNIHMNIVFLGPSLKWTPTIWEIDTTIPTSHHIKSMMNTWETYEEACDMAIKFCLEKLIR